MRFDGGWVRRQTVERYGVSVEAMVSCCSALGRACLANWLADEAEFGSSSRRMIACVWPISEKPMSLSRYDGMSTRVG